MANYTKNYGFKKPESNDLYNIDDFNEALEKVDEELGKVNFDIEDKINRINNALGEIATATGNATEAGNAANDAAENAQQKALEAGEAITNLNAALEESKKAIEETNSAKKSAIEATEKVENALVGIVDIIYPVGSIYMSVHSDDPSTYFEGTMWMRWGEGRVPVGFDDSQEEFNRAEKTGGEKTHVLTESELPSHAHSIPKLTGTAAEAGEHTHKTYYRNDNLLGNDSDRIGTKNANAGTRDAMEASGKHTHTISTNASNTGTTGTGAAHNNMPPYITCYMWRRMV